MVLFDETRVLNPQADKTNVALSFSVPPGLTALQVEFTYDPPTPPEPVAVEAVLSAHCVLCPVTCHVRVIGEETE